MPKLRRRPSCARRSRRSPDSPARSATGMSAIAAPSAVRSPTMIRPPIIPPPCSGLAPPSSPIGAPSRRTIFLSRSMRRRSSRARSSPRIDFPVPDHAGYAKFRSPASRYRGRGGFRRKIRRDRGAARHRRRRERRVSGCAIFEAALAQDFRPGSGRAVQGRSRRDAGGSRWFAAEYRANLVLVHGAPGDGTSRRGVFVQIAHDQENRVPDFRESCAKEIGRTIVDKAIRELEAGSGGIGRLAALQEPRSRCAAGSLTHCAARSRPACLSPARGLSSAIVRATQSQPHVAA